MTSQIDFHCQRQLRALIRTGFHGDSGMHRVRRCLQRQGKHFFLEALQVDCAVRHCRASQVRVSQVRVSQVRALVSSASQVRATQVRVTLNRVTVHYQ